MTHPRRGCGGAMATVAQLQVWGQALGGNTQG